MAKTKVQFHAGSLDEALRSPKLAAMLQEKAEAVAATARATAPVESGEYRDSIVVQVEQHPTRVVAHVAAKAPHAHLVEADTGNLARALGSA